MGLPLLIAHERAAGRPQHIADVAFPERLRIRAQRAMAPTPGAEPDCPC